MVERIYTISDFETLEMIHEPRRIEEYRLNRRLRGRKKHVWNNVEGQQLKARYLWNRLEDLRNLYVEQGYADIDPKDKSGLAKAKRAEGKLLLSDISHLRKRLRGFSTQPITDHELRETIMPRLIDTSLPR